MTSRLAGCGFGFKGFQTPPRKAFKNTAFHSNHESHAALTTSTPVLSLTTPSPRGANGETLMPTLTAQELEKAPAPRGPDARSARRVAAAVLYFDACVRVGAFILRSGSCWCPPKRRETIQKVQTCRTSLARPCVAKVFRTTTKAQKQPPRVFRSSAGT